jgi:methylenetetrahydrofolate reductase (NADPH)
MPVPRSGSFTLDVEVVPPAGPDPEPLLAQLEAIVHPEVAGFSVATNPLAKARMSALALCALLQARTGKPATLHCTTRDHNRLSLQALLWGARSLGIDSVLVATGDYVALGERARTTTVRDVNVYDLVRLAREAGLHVGVVLDPRTGPHPLEAAALKPVGEAPASDNPTPDSDPSPSSERPARTSPAAPHRPTSGEDPEDRNALQVQVRRLEKKIEAGAQYVVTQPAYDEASAGELHQATAHLPVPIMLGILPLRSPRHARFLHEQVAGITVPAAVQQRLAEAADPVAEGVALAAEMVALAQRWFAGALLMPPFGHYEAVDRILEHSEPSQ